MFAWLVQNHSFTMAAIEAKLFLPELEVRVLLGHQKQVLVSGG